MEIWVGLDAAQSPICCTSMIAGPEPRGARSAAAMKRFGSVKVSTSSEIGPKTVTEYCSRLSPIGASTSSTQANPLRLRRVQRKDMLRIEALDERPRDLGAGTREPQVHRLSLSAERIARATCRLDCLSTCGSDGAGAWIAIATRTSLHPPPGFSIRPPPGGTNSSGPFSPTT
jgi:hypothetical protein